MSTTKKCQFCGKPFVTRSGMQRYCSEACQAEAKRARVMQKNNLFKVAQIPICRIAGKNYYSKKHIDEFFGVAVDISGITDWLLTEEVEELFGMKPTALRAFTYRHKIPTKREYGRTYYSKSHLDELRRTDLVNDERYYTVEQVQQIYGLSSANICHIVKVKHIEKIKVGVKNLLLRSDVERVMAERNKQP